MLKATSEVLSELKTLVSSKGYIYSLLLILFEDFHHDLNKIHEIDPRSKLSLKECSLLLGFLVQNKMDLSIPESPEEVIRLKKKTYDLMGDLQMSLNAPIINKFKTLFEQQKKGEVLQDTQQSRLDFFARDGAMAEPMFYAGDGVYEFQYFEYLERKYKYDKDWLLKNRGFDIENARKIVDTITKKIREKSSGLNVIDLKKIYAEVSKKMQKKPKKKYSKEKIQELTDQNFIVTNFYMYKSLFPDPNTIKGGVVESWKIFYGNLLNLFTISPADLIGIENKFVESFFQNFSYTANCNKEYNGPGHFNILNSRPLVDLEDGRYFVPINFLLAETVYESPFYWMFEDQKYRDTLAKNRGVVGEEIAFEYLLKVFGPKNTFKSVKVESKKGQTKTDIDVLCLLGNKALCVQVKSKKLTLTAKRGDFDQLQKDFKGAVQDAYDQGLISRQAILSNTVRYFDETGAELTLPSKIDEVYIMGLTTENYPALVHQVHTMLIKDSKDPFPLFISGFDLELLAYYLKDPYDFLYYIRQRIDLIEYFRADEELVYLGYHLDRKLSRIDGYDYCSLETDFGGLIDRNYYPHKMGLSHLLSKEDDPIQNRWIDSDFELLLREIKSSNHPQKASIIFHLLDWSGDTRKDVVGRLIKTKNSSHLEGQPKSIATASSPYFGVSYTVIPSTDPKEIERKVAFYTTFRKYASKCNAWIGLGAFSESTRLVDYILYDDSVWKYDIEFEKKNEQALASLKSATYIPVKGKVKQGRNEPCSCGSGKKFKKCCGQ